MRRIGTSAALALMLGAAGCAGLDEDVEVGRLGEPFAAGDRVVQIDERLGELWSIDADPGAERIEVARTVLGGEVLAHAVRADGVVVVVTGAGQVLAVDPVAGAVVASRTVEAPFDA
ncbi:MAG: hypothetical protein H6698_07070, partial [Myxococcales bacterium]|nr:hypothetical protein [Myxococcales bacterium]